LDSKCSLFLIYHITVIYQPVWLVKRKRIILSGYHRNVFRYQYFYVYPTQDWRIGPKNLGF